MLTITISEVELFDEKADKFIKLPETTLLLEHSLVSLSKWESFYKKPFMGREEKSVEETIAYIRYMNLSPLADQRIFDHLNSSHFKLISDYIDDPMTATTIKEAPQATRGTGQFVTSELVYYWMIALNIPVEFQHWHFNRLLTLIKVSNEKNSPPKKMSRRDAAAQQRALNEERLARMNTTG